MKFRPYCTMFVMLALATGCATIVSGTKQELSFKSNPEGAEVIVNGTSVGVTPLTVKVKRKQGTQIVVRKDGFQEQSFVLKHSMEPWFWGNILIGGLFGSTTDFASGATVEYEQDQYYTTLEPVAAESAESTMDTSETPENKVIRYVLVNYNDLAVGLNDGDNEKLVALLDLLDIPAEERETATATIKGLFEEHKEIPAFAEAVAAAFAKT